METIEVEVGYEIWGEIRKEVVGEIESEMVYGIRIEVNNELFDKIWNIQLYVMLKEIGHDIERELCNENDWR